MAGVMRPDLLWPRLRWETGRAARAALSTLGWAGLAGAALIAFALALWLLSLQWSASAAAQARAARTATEVAAATPASQAELNDQRLGAFYAYLLPQADIPGTVQSLIELAKAHRLLLKTGDYRAQSGGAGNFLGYRIALPVKGDAAAIQEFLAAALEKHRTLSLESVVFKRERIEARDIEARFQFVLLTRSTAVARSNALEVASP